MVKASAGGGGKGIRIVRTEDELDQAFEAAQSETKAAFGDDQMYMEKVIEHARHIEVQVLGDHFGNVIHLGERDCSLQRKNQKVLEEAPSPALSEETREKMCKSAVLAAKAAGYESAGTIEFLYDHSGQYYFMEMNTRIQVEHPITEFITGVDLVRGQLRIAAGMALGISQEKVTLNGYALECRITATVPGTIKGLHLPGGNGVRVDTALYQGYQVPANYDALLAKIITYAPTREIAVKKMQVAIDETVIEGVGTNLDFLYRLLNNQDVLDNKFDIEFIDRLIKEDAHD